MNKNKLLLSGLMLLAISVFTWSCKDDFTEEDYLKEKAKLDAEANQSEKDSIALTINIYNASISAGSTGGRVASGKGLTGLTVKLSADGVIQSATTSAEGIATFFVQPGSVAGVISGTGFATENFVLTIAKGDNINGKSDLSNASVTLPAFATTGATVAKVSGILTYEGDLLNNAKEFVPAGTTIAFAPTVASLTNYFDGNIFTPNADLDKFTIEGNFIATVTTNGAYSIDLPTGANGLVYTWTFSSFTAPQNIAVNKLENDVAASASAKVVSIPTVFSSTGLPGNNFSNIPSVPAVLVDIDAPPAAGTGAAASLKLLPTSVTGGGGFTILASGSGYPVSSATVPVTVNGGDFDAAVTGSTAAALLASTNSLGQITAITGTLGFGYRSQATLTIGGGGTGAVVRVNYASTVAPTFGTNAAGTSGTSLTNGGTGYFAAPVLEVKGFDALGNAIEGTASSTVSGGSVVDFNVPGTAFAKLDVVSFRPVSRVNAIANLGTFTGGVNNSGEFTFVGSAGVGINTAGAGYNPLVPPNVTVRALRGGTNAKIGAKMSTITPGAVDYLYVIDRGTGYYSQLPSAATSANFPTGPVAFTPTGSATNGTTALLPGTSYVVFANYGTGIRTAGVE